MNEILTVTQVQEAFGRLSSVVSADAELTCDIHKPIKNFASISAQGSVIRISKPREFASIARMGVLEIVPMLGGKVSVDIAYNQVQEG